MNRENAPPPSSPGSCDEIILSSPLTRESFPLKTIAWLLVDACKRTKNEGRRDRNMEGRLDDERNSWKRISPVQSFTCFTFFCDSVLLESSRVWLTARASRPGGGVWGVGGQGLFSLYTSPVLPPLLWAAAPGWMLPRFINYFPMTFTECIVLAGVLSLFKLIGHFLSVGEGRNLSHTHTSSTTEVHVKRTLRI